MPLQMILGSRAQLTQLSDLAFPSTAKLHEASLSEPNLFFLSLVLCYPKPGILCHIFIISEYQQSTTNLPRPLPVTYFLRGIPPIHGPSLHLTGIPKETLVVDC